MTQPATLDHPPTDAPPRWRRMQDVAIAAALMAVGIALLVVKAIGYDELSEETAQRVCLSAMEREAGGEVAGIDIGETRQIAGGYVVSATVHGEPVRLTCETTIQDGRVVTTVKNQT